MISKTSWRQQLKTQRASLPKAKQQQAAQQIAEQFAKQPLFLQTTHLAFYHALNGELDPAIIIEQAWQAGKFCYLPQVLPNRQLAFLHYEKNSPLVDNQFGIAEPTATQTNTYDIEQLDLIGLPLLGCDLTGTRLGMGGGFYDKSLAPLEKKPLLVGLAYEFQVVSHLPHEPHDITLDFILTEQRCIDCRKIP